MVKVRSRPVSEGEPESAQPGHSTPMELPREGRRCAMEILSQSMNIDRTV
jgi:hypothetical protein